LRGFDRAAPKQLVRVLIACDNITYVKEIAVPHRINLWDTANGSIAHRIALPAGLPSSIDVSPNGRYLAAMLDDGELRELIVGQRSIKDHYTTKEVADILSRKEYTVREWCRLGRIRAKKKPCGRGKGGERLVSHEELTRLRNEGLLPFNRPA
jgi:hypothetical protein